MTYSYRYPRPSLTVDAVVFGLHADSDLRVLLIERGETPYRGRWALPGGFVRMDEDLPAAVRRELLEETGVAPSALWQIGAFGAPERDPRGRVVSVAWTALVRVSDHTPEANSDAAAAAWFDINQLPDLAFDHEHILTLARDRLSDEISRSPIAAALLPNEFTLTQWQRLHEAVVGERSDKRNFRKWAKGQRWIEATGRRQQGVPHRAAELYRFVAGTEHTKNNPLVSREVEQ